MPVATLIPNADGTLNDFLEVPIGSGTRYDKIDEDPDTHDSNTTYFFRQNTSGSQDILLTDTPSDFGAANSIIIKVAAASLDGTPSLGVQLFVNGVNQGETIPVVTSAYQVFSLTNASWDKPWTKAQMDACWLRFVMYSTGKPDDLRVTAARALVDYALPNYGGTPLRSSVFG